MLAVSITWPAYYGFPRELSATQDAPQPARRVLAAADARTPFEHRRFDLSGVCDRWQAPHRTHNLDAGNPALYRRQAAAPRRTMSKARDPGAGDFSRDRAQP